MIKKLKGSSHQVRRSQILLKADVVGPAWMDQQIADALSCSRPTVENVRERLVAEGFRDRIAWYATCPTAAKTSSQWRAASESHRARLGPAFERLRELDVAALGGEGDRTQNRRDHWPRNGSPHAQKTA